MQVRISSESIAFHVSGHVESKKTNQILDRLIHSQYKLYLSQVSY